MNAFVHTIAVILLFASCCTNTAKGNAMEISSMVDSVRLTKKSVMAYGQPQLCLVV